MDIVVTIKVYTVGSGYHQVVRKKFLIAVPSVKTVVGAQEYR
jgi:hypothetical protein